MGSEITIGSNVYRLRKEARLTQDDLASFVKSLQEVVR